MLTKTYRASIRFKQSALVVLLALVTSAGIVPLAVQAQAVNYIDAGGNIHFAESLAQVPPQYRSQIVKPTPAPVLTKKQRAALARQQMMLERQKMKVLKKKKDQLKRKKGATSSTKAPGQLRAVVFYTSPTCKACYAVERFLRDNQISYKKRDVLKVQSALIEFNDLNVGTELPTLKIGTHIVQGYKPEITLELATRMGMLRSQQKVARAAATPAKGTPTGASAPAATPAPPVSSGAGSAVTSGSSVSPAPPAVAP